MDDADFQQLLGALRAGTPAAIEELDRRQRPYLCQVTRPWLVGGPLARVADSSDLVQTVLYKFVTALQQGRFPDLETCDQMEKVLCRIAKNEFRNLWKKERRTPRDSTPDPAGQNVADLRSSPSQHVARSELEELFVIRLSAQARQIHTWRESGWEWSQIGAALQQPANTVRIRYQRECARIAHELGIENLG